MPVLEVPHVLRHKVGDFRLLSYAEFPAVVGSRWSDRFAEALPKQGTVGIEGLALLICRRRSPIR